jgi:hypothetical protein
MMWLDTGVNYDRTIAAPMLVDDRSTYPIDVPSRITSGKDYPQPITQLARNEVGIVNQGD